MKAIKTFSFLFLISATVYGQAAYSMNLVFQKTGKTKDGRIDPSQPVCIYLANGYRPVTKSAVEAVSASGGKSCSAKAETVLFKKTGKMFIKMRKADFNEATYQKIKKAYYESL